MRYRDMGERKRGGARPGSLGKLKFLLKQTLGTRLVGYIHSYREHVLWERIYRKHLPRAQGLKVLEVRSAPGKQLVKLHQVFGYIPFGVEYSDYSVVVNRQEFVANNINPDNVIHADFFSHAFQRNYEAYCDLMLSVSLVEHFTDVGEVIEKHLHVLKDGRFLILRMPNLRGINYLLARLLDRELVSAHNISIMGKRPF